MHQDEDGATNIWFNGTSSSSNGVWENHFNTTTTDNDGKLYILFRKTCIEEIFNNYWVQLEEGTVATEYEPCQKETATANADGTASGLMSISPNMTLTTDSNGVIINCQYYRDIDKYINNLISAIALTGGV